MADIFISYAREDSERIKLLASGLASHGRSVFWDRTIPPGKTWRNWIGKALAEARCVVVAWSEASIDSGWVCEEAEEGKERNILVPVFLENVRPPMGFRAIQAADLVGWQGDTAAEGFIQLTDAIAAIVEPRNVADGGSISRHMEEIPAATPAAQPVRTSQKGGVELALIPGGRFLMGLSNDDSEGSDDERPQHQVEMPAFYLGRYP